MLSPKFERLLALIQKEWLQVFRDPSALLVAFVLPIIMLFIFGFGLSFDAKHVKIGIALEDRGSSARAFWNTFDATEYFDAVFYGNRSDAEQALADGDVRAVIIVPNDFSETLERGEAPSAQALIDGTEANLSVIVEAYALGAYAKFLTRERMERGFSAIAPAAGIINVETQMRYNESRMTRNSLVPGSIVLILAMIGTLLTTLVVAREWERGTMEATLATAVGKFEMILGKLIPYFLLGLGAATLCAVVAKYAFHVPFRGSLTAYYLTASVFLLAATGQGLLISTVCRDQTIASSIALLSSFLPNFIFSGVLFEIDAMPLVLRALSYLFPARYYASSLQTIFMVGDAWTFLVKNMAAIGALASILLVATVVKTRSRLE